MQSAVVGRNPKPVHPEDIKAKIRKTGVSLADLSHKLGYDRSAISRTLCQPWPAVEAAIASHLGVPAQSLWPDRYDAEGHPLSNPASKRSRAAANRLRRKSASA